MIMVFATKKTEKWTHKTTHQPSHWNGFAAKSFHQAIAPTAMAMQHLGNPWILEAITMKIGGITKNNPKNYELESPTKSDSEESQFLMKKKLQFQEMRRST